jgi:hypothetical protein
MVARFALSAPRTLAGIGTIVTGIAPARGDGGVAHRVGRETRGRIGVAVAALDHCHWNVRRRRHAGRGSAVVTARTVGIGRRVGELTARPTGEGRGCAGVTGDAVAAIGGDVAGKRRRTLRAFRSLAGERAVVTGVAPAGADRTVIHGVSRETRRRIVVTVAALDSGHRDMRRRLHAGCGGAVVTARTIGIVRRVSEFPAHPAGEG